jgi:SAM-dependent methyltransferase
VNFGRRGVFLKMIRAKLGELAGRNILELGGGGPNYRLLALRKWAGANVTALDFSPVALEQVKQVFHLHREAVQVIHANLLDWQPNRTYDVVTHWGVIEHFSDPAPVLRVSQQCLTPPGSLLFSMPNMHAWASVFWRKWAPANWSTHVLHEVPAIDQACHATQLRLVELFYFGVPSLQVAHWEHQGWMPSLVGRLQQLAKVSGLIFPYYHVVGGKRISMHRGVLAVNTRASSWKNVA